MDDVMSCHVCRRCAAPAIATQHLFALFQMTYGWPMGNLKKCEKMLGSNRWRPYVVGRCHWTNVASCFMVVIRCRFTYALQALRIRKCRDIKLLLFLAQTILVANCRHTDAEVVHDFLQRMIGILLIPHLWVARCSLLAGFVGYFGSFYLL